MKSYIFWDITLCSPLNSTNVSGVTFLWNVGWLSMRYMVLCPKRWNSSFNYVYGTIKRALKNRKRMNAELRFYEWFIWLWRVGRNIQGQKQIGGCQDVILESCDWNNKMIKLKIPGINYVWRVWILLLTNSERTGKARCNTRLKIWFPDEWCTIGFRE
jgi:hypothetical protein